MKLSARKVAIFLLLSFLMGVSLAILPLGCAQYYSPTCTVDASVNYPGAGTLTPGSGSIVYNYGDYVVYTEYTNPGYSFDGWYLNGVYEGQLSSIPITIYMDYQLIAVFSVSSAFLTISSSAGGTTDPGTGVWNYTYGSIVTVSESPNSGATFSGWYLDGTYMGTTTSLKVTMNQDHQVNAFFAGGNNITATPAPTSMPAPTSNPNLLSPILQFYCTSSTSYSTFNIEIQGVLEYNDSGLVDGGVYFSYSVTNGATWQDFAYVETGYYGNFSAVWMPSASGDYVIRAVYFGNSVYSAETSTVNFELTPLVNQNQDVFSVISNSTISSLSFDSTTDSLSFGVSGPSGTTGYSQICIAKSLLPDVTALTVTLDGSTIAYSHFSSGDAWLITIYYHHSSHSIVMALNSQASLSSPTPVTSVTLIPTANPTASPSIAATPTPTPEFPLVILPLFLVIVSLAIMVMLRKRAKTNA